MKEIVPISHSRKQKSGLVGTTVESASKSIDAKIKELGDWRGKMLAKVRGIIHAADPEMVEEWKWRRRHRRACRCGLMAASCARERLTRTSLR